MHSKNAISAGRLSLKPSGVLQNMYTIHQVFKYKGLHGKLAGVFEKGVGRVGWGEGEAKASICRID